MTLRAEKVVASVALAAILHPTFQWVGDVASVRSATPPSWFITPIDRVLPIVPMAVWVYLSWYPASMIGFLADRPAFRRLYLSYVAAFVVCVGTYLLFPMTIERPIVDGDGLSQHLLRAVYDMDRPTNLFPSFHAAVAAILLHSVRPSRRLLRAAVVAWMLSISAACILTKQHYVLDVVAGLAVGFLATRAAEALPIGAGRSSLCTAPGDAAAELAFHGAMANDARLAHRAAHVRPRHT